MRAAIANPVPVLPDVGSMIVPPGLRRPSRSAASTRRIATRSLIEPPGLKYSTLATICGTRPAPMRASRTSGVSPTVSRMESLMSGSSVVRGSRASIPSTIRNEVESLHQSQRPGRGADLDPLAPVDGHAVALDAVAEDDAALPQLAHHAER